MSELDTYFQAQGINPQWFPIYYSFEARPFQINGQPSGAFGAIARLTRSLPNPPHVMLGIRVSNVYPLPDTADAAAVERYLACKNHVDGEQTLEFQLAQQNVVATIVLQKHVTGGQDGFSWYPFPDTFPMAGANDVSIVLTRITGYPTIADEPVLPQAFCTLVCSVGRRGEGYGATSTVQRVHRP